MYKYLTPWRKKKFEESLKEGLTEESWRDDEIRKSYLEYTGSKEIDPNNIYEQAVHTLCYQWDMDPADMRRILKNEG